MIDIKSLEKEELQAQLQKQNIPAFRAKQIASWLDKGVLSFGEMKNLPKDLQETLAKQYVIPGVAIEKKYVSKIDGTVKYLFSLSDGEVIESVLMKYKHGWSQCLSTQVGCRMGCTFCATGMEGCKRDLLPSEMLSQIEVAQKDNDIRVSSIVLMGMGEPLDNYENVLRFLELLSEEGGVHIGMRHVSLSTCGLVDKIKELQQLNLQLTLSVSLHAPNDAIRLQLMPIAKKWSVEELLAACREYAKTTSRRISFEYAMFDGINDSKECAMELAEQLKGMLCHVNLIPGNTVAGSRTKRSSASRLKEFQTILDSKGIPVTVRRTLGADINASCGQLRRGDREEI
ncbi:MAG: 23S rRNA (adenine(2503)-C(2))-methyltransferase RlmN [Clostridia bacterium]|nr:23S rRNA (adenine(2503)-C(2))-methyltransferase RlmN [Clostridia bacterium]